MSGSYAMSGNGNVVLSGFTFASSLVSGTCSVLYPDSTGQGEQSGAIFQFVVFAGGKGTNSAVHYESNTGTPSIGTPLFYVNSSTNPYTGQIVIPVSHSGGSVTMLGNCNLTAGASGVSVLTGSAVSGTAATITTVGW